MVDRQEAFRAVWNNTTMFSMRPEDADDIPHVLQVLAGVIRKEQIRYLLPLPLEVPGVEVSEIAPFMRLVRQFDPHEGRMMFRITCLGQR